MNANLVAILYLAAGALFILALRGLSNPETSRRGNLFGMIGMAIAIATRARAKANAASGFDAINSISNSRPRIRDRQRPQCRRGLARRVRTPRSTFW